MKIVVLLVLVLVSVVMACNLIAPFSRDDMRRGDASADGDGDGDGDGDADSDSDGDGDGDADGDADGDGDGDGDTDADVELDSDVGCTPSPTLSDDVLNFDCVNWYEAGSATNFIVEMESTINTGVCLASLNGVSVHGCRAPVSDGDHVCVFVVDRLQIDHRVRVDGDVPLVFLIRHDAAINAHLDVSAEGEMPGPGGKPGGVQDHPDGLGEFGGLGGVECGGGGGGGLLGLGGEGGCANSTTGTGGGVLESCITLTRDGELIGGSGGGSGGGENAGRGGPGGGSVHIFALGRIEIADGGLISANGAAGFDAATGGCSGGGGGSGGTVVLETYDLDFTGGAIEVMGGNGGHAPSVRGGEGAGLGERADVLAGENGEEDGVSECVGAGGGGGAGRLVVRDCTDIEETVELPTLPRGASCAWSFESSHE